MAARECRSLLEAVKRNDLTLVREFLNRGELINQRNSYEETVLLLARGAPVNERDSFGRTPLDYALYMEREEFATLLKSHGGEESGIPWRFPRR